MVKIVVNACFGGFGLSKKAVKRYLELKGINAVYINDHGDDYNDLWCIDGIKDEDHIFDPFSIDRADPALIQVVEELAETSGDWAAYLVVKDIPAGTRYFIEEYDGRETVVTENSIKWEIA